MAARPILQLGHPVLRQVSKRVHRIDDSVQRLIDDMIDSMHTANGAGLAAPQVGIPLRVMITLSDDELQVFINPEIVSLSEESEIGDEGCLSIVGLAGPVERALRCDVRALDRHGKKQRVRAEGWFARVIQHEVDHLDGILYVDRVTDKSAIHRVDEDDRDNDEVEELVPEPAEPATMSG